MKEPIFMVNETIGEKLLEYSLGEVLTKDDGNVFFLFFFVGN